MPWFHKIFTEVTVIYSKEGVPTTLQNGLLRVECPFSCACPVDLNVSNTCGPPQVLSVTFLASSSKVFSQFSQKTWSGLSQQCLLLMPTCLRFLLLMKHDQKASCGRKGLWLALPQHYSSSKEIRTRTPTPKKGAAYWFIPYSLLSLLSYIAQDH